jgi:aspartyl-tRNA(Asn)/glutamyl-tRNA(Gln) amidotransferase subunit C
MLQFTILNEDETMKITREDVLRVAELAHLELSEAEVESFGRHLDSILTYADKLNELDTTGVEPMAQVLPPGAAAKDQAYATPMREDVPVPSHVVEDVLAGAPDASPPYFRVPRVIERGE